MARFGPIAGMGLLACPRRSLGSILAPTSVEPANVEPARVKPTSVDPAGSRAAPHG